MAGIGSSVRGGSRRRWLVRLVVLVALAAALWPRSDRSDDHAGNGSASAHGGTANGSSLKRDARDIAAMSRQVRLPTIRAGALRLEGIVVDDEEHPVAGVHVAIGVDHEMT